MSIQVFLKLILSLGMIGALSCTAAHAEDPPGSSKSEAISVMPAAATPQAALLPSPLDYRKMRDPFKHPMVQGKEEKLKSELETIPVSELVMAGVITGPHKTRAILRSTSGKIFVVSEGTRVGIQNGYVRKILEDRVIVNESIVDILGEREVVTQEVKLVNEGGKLARANSKDSTTGPSPASGDGFNPNGAPSPAPAMNGAQGLGGPSANPATGAALPLESSTATAKAVAEASGTLKAAGSQSSETSPPKNIFSAPLFPGGPPPIQGSDPTGGSGARK